jgi:hypothetical protein
MLTKNPNLKRRRSQESIECKKKKEPLNFEDLFNLKQKLLGNSKHNTDKELDQFLTEELHKTPFAHSSPLQISKKYGSMLVLEYTNRRRQKRPNLELRIINVTQR